MRRIQNTVPFPARSGHHLPFAGFLQKGPQQEGLAARQGVRRSYRAQQVICREGDPVERLCLIRKGIVKLVTYLPNGRSRILRLHARGHWLGLEGLLRQPSQHTALAVNDVELETFSTAELLRIQAEDPQRLGQVLRQWHADLRQADRWISEFSTGNIKPRVARLLEYLAELQGDEPSYDVALLTVNEMADILGVTQESVSRILAEFKRCSILRKQAHPLREAYRLDTRRLQQEAIK